MACLLFAIAALVNPAFFAGRRALGFLLLSCGIVKRVPMKDVSLRWLVATITSRASATPIFLRVKVMSRKSDSNDDQ